MERTLIILKPDAVQRQLVGRIIGRFEDKGFKIVGAKLRRIPRQTLERHYSDHKGKPFYQRLLAFMSKDPVVILALEGKNAIAVCRKMMGATFGSKADAGTIRGDFGISDSFNLIHGSDSPEAAAKELQLFFDTDELVSYDIISAPWIYDEDELVEPPSLPRTPP
ncbi:MAG: nucleoside-diphosphate kinase [Planctomycetes bacterium]|nr:nucleoside-diphosphate kinase [Planctomycetota bacterium]